MADRRMMSKTVIDTDMFLDMPISAQSLYFHLLLRADDDGFLKNIKTIMRTVGASPDDIRLLIAKQYLLLFESGVVAIKHWRVHNVIRKDRYKPTTCGERNLIELDSSGEYKLLTTAGIPNGNQLTTAGIPNGNQLTTAGIPNGNPGKVRLGKVRLEKREKREVTQEEKSKEKNSRMLESKKLIEVYQKSIKPVTGGMEHEKLLALLDSYGLDLCLKAIDRAVLRKKRSFGYVEGILRRWRQDGYDEPEEENDDGRYVKRNGNPAEEIKNIPF